ncbi:hypothetical protein [Bradyrhizobium sp. 192]|uniref:hypothetical protein n=1 Tax=Bradyrhizobium sp. 192 TaxID=2782660 RepID=UPI001FFEB38F|nr:hypothetical protein [Bradyrhizobium sp. 192]UPJ55012.1 hypothetical protein IVB24_20160 [Bradyrhizobium sp. 192]
MTDKKLAVRDEFTSEFGRFFGIWQATELALDYAVGKYLELADEETHLLTAGMDFNRKARLLTALVKRNNDPQQSAILASLKIIQNESLRNVFAHSFVDHTDTEVTFIQRNRHGNYDPIEYTFTLPSFIAHVEKILRASIAFHDAVGLTEERYEEFASAALRVNTKPTTSPVPPNDKA